MTPVLEPATRAAPSSGAPQLLALCAIRAAAARRPDHIAVRELTAQGELVAETSYGLLVERMDRAAHMALDTLGLKPGDIVAILSHNSTQFMEVTCGVSAAGIGVAKISPRLSSAEVAAILADCGASVVFVHPDCTALLAEVPAGLRVITLDDVYEDMIALASAQPLTPAQMAGEDDVFVIPYTSGTTGKPKGVVISHRARNVCCYAMGIEFGCFGPDDSFLALAPLAHGAGFAMALAGLMFGARCDLLQGFDAATVLRLLNSRAHTGVFFVPTHFHAMFALPQDMLNRYAGHGLKTIISNAAPLPQQTKEKIVAYFGEGLLNECYGSTEAGIVTNLRPPDQLRKVRCVGLPFPGTMVRLVDDDGNDVAPGEIGELLSSSTSNFQGYWDAPDETVKALRGEWVSAGDLAVKDEDGFFYIVDRKKDMILSGGMNIYPREIEEVLTAFPGVAEAAVVGLPDEYWGERVVAFLVAHGDVPEDKAVIGFCAERLADYKRPREIRWLQALPKNSNGKLLKRELRDIEQERRASLGGSGS